MWFDSITVCLDMYGCPNRCKHCWVGHSPNCNLTTEELIFVAKSFRPYTDSLKVYDWYREPDYSNNYTELWDICHKLSDENYEHFELVSFYRLVRDPEYVKWLSTLGLKKAQLTLFGKRAKTDYYTGRIGAFDEIMRAIDVLVDNKISPRIQIFINKDNISELPYVERLITDLDLESRCSEFGGEFSCFVHQGSCDGENEKLLNVWVTPNDLFKIPPKIKSYTLAHFGVSELTDVFGITESRLYDDLINDNNVKSLVSRNPVFYVDGNFDVYPNESTPALIWLLGNLKSDGVSAILDNYLSNKSPAQYARANVPLSQMVETIGDRYSLRLFSSDDYITYILNRYSRSII